jgi:hypothetical protein
MRLLALIAAIVCLAGCGYFQKQPEASPKGDDGVAALRTKSTEWDDQIEAADMDALTDCDLALWAGEARAAGALVDQDGFETGGAIRRNPKQPCTPASRDMVLGYVYGRWVAGDLAALQRVAGYGEAHGWVMSAASAISWIDFIGRSVLAHAIDVLSGGKDRRSYEAVPIDCFNLGADYEQHLTVVEAMLGAEVSEITQECAKVLAGYAAASPHDALFQAAAGAYSGDMGPAIDLLLDDAYQCPGYVRGADIYCAVHKAFAARIALLHYPKGAR